MTIENKVAFAVLRLSDQQPDSQRTGIVKDIIVLKSGVEGTEGLKSEIQQMVRQRLSTHAYPREIEFITARPKTPSWQDPAFHSARRGVNSSATTVVA